MVPGPLYNWKDILPVIVEFRIFLEPIITPSHPLGGSVHRIFDRFFIRISRWALIKGHNNVCAKFSLDLHGKFWSEDVPAAV